MATGTSAAFPLPIPTHPCPSPTTTRAQKLKRFPPFTTFATRLMKTTLSFRLNSSGLTRTQYHSSWFLSYRRREHILKLQATFAGSLGKRLDSAMVQPPSSVKHDGVDLRAFCPFRQQL